MIVQIYLVKKPYNGRKIIAKPSQRRYFAPNLGLFFKNSIIRRNFDVKPSQRRYFTSILRKKNFLHKKGAGASAYVEFTRIFGLFWDFFAQKVVHFSLGRRKKHGYIFS